MCVCVYVCTQARVHIYVCICIFLSNCLELDNVSILIKSKSNKKEKPERIQKKQSLIRNLKLYMLRGFYLNHLKQHLLFPLKKFLCYALMH